MIRMEVNAIETEEKKISKTKIYVFEKKVSQLVWHNKYADN